MIDTETSRGYDGSGTGELHPDEIAHDPWIQAGIEFTASMLRRGSELGSAAIERELAEVIVPAEPN